jgi:hypothetical protein
MADKKKEEGLFPELPEDLAAVDSSDLLALEKDIRAGIELIEQGDEDFRGSHEADEILAELKTAVEGLEQIVAVMDGRAEAAETAARETAEALEKAKAIPAARTPEIETAEVVAEVDEPTETSASEESDDEYDGAVMDDTRELVTASADEAKDKPAPPAPAKDRVVVSEPPVKITPLIATGSFVGLHPGDAFDRESLANAVVEQARRLGKPAPGGEVRTLIARAEFDFPPERTLAHSDNAGNAEKIRNVVPAKTGWGDYVPDSLTAAASANVLCAPLTPIYSMPQFAVDDRPVRDALPSFRADRGGVNVPVATTIGDITTAISLIDQADESAGGTFATKSCQDLDCPAYDETTITTIAHCRQYGNLIARTWPEKIAHENALTMAAHARTAEEYLLDRIKSLSVNVTQGADTLGALIYLVDAIVKARFGITTRLRMDPEATFRVLLPAVLPDLLGLDNVSTQFDRFQSEEQLVSYLRSYDIVPSFYIDTPTSGTSQIADASQGAGALEGLPANIQWAIFPEGAFLHLDGGSLELGVVRDSTLNRTNEFQVFGESFENVARIGPPQSAYWVTSNICPTGQFPPAGTARTCE